MTLNYDENGLEREFQCYAAISSIEQTLKEIDDLMAGDLSTAVRTVSSGIDALKKLADLAIKSKNIELQEGILGLREQMLDVKEALLSAREENASLREENKTLALKIEELEKSPKEELTFGSHGYYKDDGDGPFCVGCYDSSGKLNRVIQPYADFGAEEVYKCSVCDKYC